MYVKSAITHRYARTTLVFLWHFIHFVIRFIPYIFSYFLTAETNGFHTKPQIVFKTFNFI